MHRARSAWSNPSYWCDTHDPSLGVHWNAQNPRTIQGGNYLTPLFTPIHNCWDFFHDISYRLVCLSFLIWRRTIHEPFLSITFPFDVSLARNWHCLQLWHCWQHPTLPTTPLHTRYLRHKTHVSLLLLSLRLKAVRRFIAAKKNGFKHICDSNKLKQQNNNNNKEEKNRS